MDQNQLFSQAMGLSAPWKVVRSGLEDGDDGTKYLYVDIELEPGAKMACPCCGNPSSLYDHEVKRWRHLNFWQHCTFLSARVPRVECPEHGVRQVEVPWARSGSGFSLLFEAFVMALARDMPISAVAALMGEHDTRLWRIVRHYVSKAHEAADWSEVEAVAIDETATRKGHRYATVAVDLDLKDRKPARLLFMTPERTAESVAEFVEQMPAHGAKAEQVKVAAIDMSAAYKKGVAEHLPEAQVVFDRFHVMKLAGDAVDEVRKELRRAGHDMSGALWALRGNAERLKEEQRELRERLCIEHKELGRAMALRESLAETWNWPGPASAEMHLKGWCGWAARSRLKPFMRLAKTIKNHWAGILAYFPHRVTSAAIEAVNGIIQTARRRARGFRNFDNLRAIAYWMAGRLELKLPTPFTHPL
jgi:transposase